MIRVAHAVTFPILFILFYDRDLTGRSVPSYEKWSFFSVFSHLGPFPLVFGQGKEWLMLELHGTIQVPDAVLCPVVFNLLDRLKSGLC